MFTIAEIARATGGEIVGNDAGEVTGVSTDSRMVAAGELFVPLVGERFDGHDYIEAALARGVRVFIAAGEWISRKSAATGATCIVVADTLRGLGDLAVLHRTRFALPVVVVTGSNG